MDPKGGRAKKGSEEAKDHWKMLEYHCKYEGSLEPECINAWYYALSQENDLEWWMSMENWWNFQPIIAFMGMPIAMWACFTSFYFLIFPDNIPTIEDAPWEDVPFFFRGAMIQMATMGAKIVQPDFFFWSQLFTWGESNLSDLELIYMTPFDVFVYYFLESMYLPFAQFFSFIWFGMFWWAYMIEWSHAFFVATMRMIIHEEAGEDSEIWAEVFGY